MKAIWYDGKGDTSVLKQGEVPDPIRKGGELLIEVKAFALNRADLLQRRGLYPPPAGASTIPGLEAAGVVLEAEESSPYQKGDRVMALVAGGGYGTRLTVLPEHVLPIPPKLAFDEAAAIPEAFLTAHHNLFHLGRAKKDETALVHAGASGVGTAAIQLLRSAGLRVLVTVGDEDKAHFCEKLGAEAIIYKTQDFAEVVTKKTVDRGVDLILDCIGADYFPRNLDLLTMRGRLVVIGLMGGDKSTIDLGLVLRKRLSLLGSTLRALSASDKAGVVRRFRDGFYARLEKGELRPIVYRVYPPEEIATAQQEMEENRNTGKIVVRW